MTAPSAEDRIRDWLETELDSVPAPQRALDEAVRAATTLAQYHDRHGLRSWLGDRQRGGGTRVAQGIPEVILEPASADRFGPSTDAGVAVSPRIPFALGAAAVGVVAVVVGVLLVGLPGIVHLNPAGDTQRLGALALERPTESGRDIIVSGDGSGHFWSISDAISQAVDGDRIIVKPGEYEGSISIAGKDVSITGEGGPGAVTVRPTRDGPMSRPAGYTSPSDFDSSDTFDASNWVVPEEWRYVFFLQDSDVHISNLSILGSRVGSAVIVDGGAPVLDDVIIDPDGAQPDGDPLEPHEALYVYGGSRATLQNSEAYALISIRDASKSTLRGNLIDGTCVLITGEGTNPLLTGNTIRAQSEVAHCGGFSIAINGGAAPQVDTNDIENDRHIDGIIVLGPATAPTIQGNAIMGADVGIWVGGGARGYIARNNVTGANTGIEVVGSSPYLDTNSVFQNEVGVSIDDASTPDFVSMEVCDNVTNLDLQGGALVPMELNPLVCPNDDLGGSTSG